MMNNKSKFSNFTSKKIRINKIPSLNNNNIMSSTFYNSKSKNFFFKEKEI